MPLASDWNSILGFVSAGESLTIDQATAAIQSIMSGEVPDAQVRSFLTALHEKGETAAEVAGAARGCASMHAIRTGHDVLLDTRGTGGDGAADIQHQHCRSHRRCRSRCPSRKTWQNPHHQQKQFIRY